MLWDRPGTDRALTAADVRREAWDNAVLVLLYEQSLTTGHGLGGDELLAAILDEANDAMARLAERGMIERDDEDDEA